MKIGAVLLITVLICTLYIVYHGIIQIQGEFSYLASGSRDRSVKLWDPLKGVCLMTFSAHENWVRCVVFYPSCKYILSCSDDKTIRVLDIKVYYVILYYMFVCANCCSVDKMLNVV